MKQILLLIALMVPVFAFAYGDHRGHDLDSLERVLEERFTPDRLAVASPEEQADYVRTCRQLAWGYLQLDGPRSVYYARQAIQIAVEQYLLKPITRSMLENVLKEIAGKIESEQEQVKY